MTKTERQQRHEHAWAIMRHVLGQSLTSARTGRKWGIPELARRADVYARRISEIESGADLLPTKVELIRLATALDVGLHIGFVPLSTLGIQAVPSFEAERRKPGART